LNQVARAIVAESRRFPRHAKIPNPFRDIIPRPRDLSWPRLAWTARQISPDLSDTSCTLPPYRSSRVIRVLRVNSARIFSLFPFHFFTGCRAHPWPWRRRRSI